jgi:DNA topoisomerase-3
VQVKNESGKRIAVESEEKKAIKKSSDVVDCPKCKSGTLLKGKTAFGCSNFKNGCDFKIPFELMGKKLTDAQLKTLAEKGKTPIIKGFDLGGSKKDGILKLASDFNIEFEEKKASPTKAKTKKEEMSNVSAPSICPKCNEGTVIKGKTAYGCSNWKNGCDWRLAF